MEKAVDLPNDPQRPPIALRNADRRALLAIAYDGLLRDTRSAGALLSEVSRADLVADDAPSRTAGLWSRVLFRAARADSAQWIVLAPPEHAHEAAEHVSVLSPLGAALIGMSKGQHICCPDRHGGELSLTVLDVISDDQGPGGQS